MNRWRSFIAISAAFLIGSCAFHSGTMSDSASLEGGDFELVKMGFGTASTTHIFGIGGLDQTGLVLNAKRDLYLNYPLKKGQAYANISVDFKRSFFLLAGTTIATISADIVQFGPAPPDENQKLFTQVIEWYDFKMEPDTNDLAILVNGELVPVRIRSIDSDDRYLLADAQGNTFAKIRESMIFNITPGFKNNKHGYSVGDIVSFEQNYFAGEGKVIGVSSELLLVDADEKLHEIFLIYAKVEKKN